MEYSSFPFLFSIYELMNRERITNKNISANMLRCKLYVCPICGNIIHSMGNAIVSCCGITLPPLEAEIPEDNHAVTIENVEDEHFITICHPMTKDHYISFVAFVTSDRMQLVKLYPEENPQTRLQLRGMQFFIHVHAAAKMFSTLFAAHAANSARLFNTLRHSAPMGGVPFLCGYSRLA